MTDRSTNVILLTIDALRADHVGYHGYERDTTPFLDDLASRAARFDTAISASSHTREALPALLSGEYPDVFAANGYRYATETIADRLSVAGYATAGFHSNPYVSRAYGYDSGFDTFDDDLLLGRHRVVALAQRALNKFVLKRGQYHVRAGDLNKRSLTWLDSVDGDQPFFLWNHYMDPHGPYNPPEGYTYADHELSNSDTQRLYQKAIDDPENISASERETLVDSYDGEIRYLDEQLRVFFDELTTRGLAAKSLIILTADHGDAFGEHGYYTHPRQLHSSLLHIPLIICLPGTITAQSATYPVSTTDIVPTILHQLGISYSDLPGTPLVSGTDLVEREDDVVFASATGEGENKDIRRFAAQNRRWKAVIERDIDSGDVLEIQAYDLKSDPREQNPVDASESEIENVVTRLRAFSASRLGREAPTSHPDSASDELNERLEALGYK